jgi:hypothetical protein
MDQSLRYYKKFLRSGVGRNWYQIGGLFRLNTTTETKSQKVDSKQNGGGLQIKGFKLLTAILFWINLFWSGLALFSTKEQL